MDEDTCLASFTHPVPLDLFEFTLQHGADVGLVAANTKPESGGWRLLALDADPSRAVIAVSGDHILLDRSAPWQGVFAQVIINDVMRQQEDVLFFHAATASFRDCGIFLTGDKGGGKTTLALALAGHGCGFLGDEYGAVETKTRMILPMRRAVSIRPGPRAGRVDAILAGRSLVTDRTPDGTERIRASVADLLPDSVARPTRLTHAFFLRGFAPQPRLSSFLPGTGELPLLRPLLVTLWDQPPGKRVVEFLQMLDGVRCFHLEVGGTPDQTAEMILKALEVA